LKKSATVHEWSNGERSEVRKRLSVSRALLVTVTGEPINEEPMSVTERAAITNRNV
jgi:hypothetical protein